MDPVKDYSRTHLSLDNCIIPNERLLNTPSSKDGCSHELEVDLRIVGSEYIQSAGLLLRLPQVAMATAQVLFQRFYYSKSFVKYSIQPLTMASIFLAAKIEEHFRRLREVINVFHHLKQKRMGRLPSDIRPLHGSPSSVANVHTTHLFWPIVPMEFMGEEYFKLKSSVIKYERFLLKELGFCVHVKHPHKLVVTYLQMLELQDTPLVQKAWNNMNDSLRTNVFVRFSPETITCACIFLAARQLKVSLPLRPPWWQVFGAEQKDLEAISLEVLSLYSRPRKFMDSLEKEVSVLRERLAKKQVDIKEITVKKATPSVSPRTVSPLPSDKVQQTKEKGTSQSPLATAPLLETKTTSTNPSPLTRSSQLDKQASQSQTASPLGNGITAVSSKTQNNKPRKRSRSVSAEDDRMSLSASDHSRSPSPKRISSPLKLTSGSSEGEEEGDHSSSISPSLKNIPKHYRPDYENDRQLHGEKHKHFRNSDNGRRVEHRSKHSRSKYKSRGSTRDSERRREQYRKEYYDHERDKEVYSSSKSRRKYDRDYDDREYYSSSKVRKSDYVRYR